MIVQRDVVVEGVRIHYAETGEGGPPVLFVHGLGSAGIKFHDTMPHLAPHRRTIAIDLPGFGLSDAPRASYSPAWQAGALRAFLDALDIEQAIVAGNSYGGLVSLFFASAWPERTAALAMVAPALPNDGPRAPGAARWIAGTLPGIGWLGQKYYWGRPASVVVTESLERNCVDPSRVSATMVARLLQDTERKDVIPAYRRAALAAQRSTLWAMTGKREHTWSLVSSLRPPTVLIWGDQDRVVPVHVGHDAASRLSGAHLIVIDDCGHNPQMEKPEEFADALLAFVRATEVETSVGTSADTGASSRLSAGVRSDPESAVRVVLSEYDVRWPLMYEEEAARIRAALDDVVTRMEHVGSTSVPGLAAKPIIDIAATVPSFDVLPRLIEALSPLGYEYEPRYEEQIPHRRYFRKGPVGARTHHLHFYEAGHPDVESYVAFRERLKVDPAAAREYEQLKHRLSMTLTRADYTDAKAPFIQRVLDAARSDD